MYQILKQIAKTGIVTEPWPHPDDAAPRGDSWR
jgi:hypothetical protein